MTQCNLTILLLLVLHTYSIQDDVKSTRYQILPVDANNSADFKSTLIERKIDNELVVYTLDNRGTFHRSRPDTNTNFKPGSIVYTVLKNGILTQAVGQYSIKYEKNKKGDLVPTAENQCIYVSEHPSFYVQGPHKSLVPVELFYSQDHIFYVFNKRHLLPNDFSDLGKKNKNYLTNIVVSRLNGTKTQLIPDVSCNGDVSLFLLQSDGVFMRNPPDEYLPIGMKLQYQLVDDGSLTPKATDSGIQLTYVTEKYGDLKPCPNNSFTLATPKTTIKSYLLGEGGVLSPVSEILDCDKSVNYFHNGNLVLSSKQFPHTYSNTSILLLGSKNADDNFENSMVIPDLGPKFVCPSKKITKRSTGSDDKDIVVDEGEFGKSKIQYQYIVDDRGRRIHIKPFIYDDGSIALFKLNCKGYIQRFGQFSEPEAQFEVHFELLDNLILVPVIESKPYMFILRYTLQTNGSLIPVDNQTNSLKKAPGCFMYYCLSANKELFPVRVVVLRNKVIEIYYQDYLVHKVFSQHSRNYQMFSTLHEPLFAYVNSRIVLSYTESKGHKKGSTWGNPRSFTETPTKTLYLVGPSQEKIKVAPKMNKNRVSTVYVMDDEGTLHKSPKDDNRNLAIVSYMLLNRYILKKTDKPGCFMYLVDRQGNLLPYSYPSSKLTAPRSTTIKYVLCDNDILIPILCDISEGYVEYLFQEVPLFRRRIYSLEQVKKLSKGSLERILDDLDPSLHKDKQGRVAYFKLENGVFIRHPSKHVEEFMVHSIGIFAVQPDGTLWNCEYPPKNSEDIVKVRLENNGDMTIVEGDKLLKHDTYCVTDIGNLIPVTISKDENYLYIYRNGIFLHSQMLKSNHSKIEDRAPTPSGEDPLRIFEDPMPPNSTDIGPSYIPIPIMDSIAKTPAQLDEEKCSHIRKIIRDVFENDPDVQNMELEMTEALMQEFCKLASKCTVGKNRTASNLFRARFRET